MKRSRFSEEQIIRILREADGESTVKAVCAKHNISDATFYNWKRKDVWSWDFVTDQTANGSHFRILTLIDEHTRECLATHAGWSIRAVDVITIIEVAIARYGAPKHIRSDNGPEFIAYAVQDWLKELAI